MKVSVIIPVYRVPDQMLMACVDSLLKQTLSDMEFIFVVDGEDDPAWPILEAKERVDQRVKVLCNEKNRGVSASRNRGLEVMRGDWFGFVDADDWVEPDMYARLVALAEGENCDLVECGFFREMKDGGHTKNYPSGGVWGMELDFDVAQVYESTRTSCCDKLFQRAHFGNLRFREELSNHEDIVFLTMALGLSTRVGFIGEPLYHACYRADSAHRNRIDLERFSKTYLALEILAELAGKRARNTIWMQRLWAWRLLSWSLATRRYHDELPADAREEALVLIQKFYRDSLLPFHRIYPWWLREMLEWKMANPNRFFCGSAWVYTVLWQQIRLGLAPFQGRSRFEVMIDSLRRAAKKGRG